MRGVLQGLHMRVAAQNVELSITDADVDEKGQLINIESTLTRSLQRSRRWSRSY